MPFTCKFNRCKVEDKWMVKETFTLSKYDNKICLENQTREPNFVFEHHNLTKTLQLGQMILKESSLPVSF
jgi:hypothetical protein